MSRVIVTDGCHLWNGAHNKFGYPVFRQGLAHRWALARALGRPLAPKEYALHGCDNPGCVRVGPGHVYPGDQKQNMRDSIERGRFRNGATINAAKTHCPAGHPYDEANTHVRSSGRRQCRSCNAAQARARRREVRTNG